MKLIIGLGKTGVSCVRYLKQQSCDVAINDSRENPPGLDIIKKEFPAIEIKLGEFSEALFAKADELIVSPGVSLQEPLIAKAIANGVPAIGDIELFARAAKAPIIAVTGSNGKTTVTTLISLVLKAAGYNVQVCGNIGTPVLDLLQEPTPDFYVLELSSFQLETTLSLKAKVAVLLNVSPDHMDRYADLHAYLLAKQRIYNNCEIAIVNYDEPETFENLNLKHKIVFTVHQPQANQFGLCKKNKKIFLACGDELLFDVAELKLQGLHHWQNALVVFVIAHALKIPNEIVIPIIKTFSGIEHRCQWVANKKGADWFNDSKGTNVGATIAALTSLGQHKVGQLIWIAGGDAKQADLTSLREPVKQYVKQAILLGQDAPQIQQVIDGIVPTTCVNSLQEAVEQAAQLVTKNDRVLLSPACASFDMFTNYEHRGEVFIKAVMDL